MASLGEGAGAGGLFEDVDIEPINLPDVVETLFDAAPEIAREAVEAGHLTLRTREALPYGLAIFDDGVAIGGYDETTGAMAAFVDTGATYAREWAERTYAAPGGLGAARRRIDQLKTLILAAATNAADPNETECRAV